jgi:hypothetical protein
VLTYNHSLQHTILNDSVNQFKVGLESDKGYFTLKVKTMTLMSHFFARNSTYLLFFICVSILQKVLRYKQDYHYKHKNVIKIKEV